MRILDRYIIRSFQVNYLLALGALVGMYILLDLVVNFDNFTKSANAITDPTQSTDPTSSTSTVDFSQLLQSLVNGTSSTGSTNGTASSTAASLAAGLGQILNVTI